VTKKDSSHQKRNEGDHLNNIISYYKSPQLTPSMSNHSLILKEDDENMIETVVERGKFQNFRTEFNQNRKSV
tara:strand:+ start:339 stop:554 length:216 start_codon:yes stop_codon:yes gene_type:complete